MTSLKTESARAERPWLTPCLLALARNDERFAVYAEE